MMSWKIVLLLWMTHMVITPDALMYIILKKNKLPQKNTLISKKY